MALKLLVVLGIVVVLLALLLALGPRPRIDTRLKKLSLPSDLDRYLRETESQFGDLRPDVEKRIAWAGKAGERTGVSIVYLHGFSATHREIAPVCEKVAAALGANVFFSRLAGHGRSSEALAEPSVNDWLNDGWEALAIGRRIGQQVWVIGTSNGGSLATWLLAQPEGQQGVAGLVLISPNFGPRDKRSRILTWPWGSVVAEWIRGKTFHWTPKSDLHARYWTISYPTRALTRMQALVILAKKADKSTITVPTLCLYTRHDRVVDPEEIERALAQFGGVRKRLVAYEGASEDGHHVLAGDALSPQSNEEVATIITDFVRAPLVAP